MLNTTPQWFAVLTRPNQERRARVNLERQGFACFLPEVENTRRSRIEALFPRYLFLKATPGVQNLSTIRSTRGVSTLVRFGERLATVPERIVETIRNRVDPETGLVRLPRLALHPGDRVSVDAGPLAGVEAVFKAPSSRQRVLLLMELLGRQITVEVDALSLRRAV